ncbi:MAG: OsmC family protein [Desulfovibrio sp.]|nr:OsmC family protein [Desulfovibrio sp.]
MSQQVSVSLQRRGSIIDLDMESTALGCMHVDNSTIPEAERAGSAKKLLGSSVLYCYVAALDKALDTRGAKYESIDAKATVTAGTDDKGRGRILGITLDVIVRMDADFEEIFDRVSKVMRNGCLISASLEPAFPVTYNLQLECPDD